MSYTCCLCRSQVNLPGYVGTTKCQCGIVYEYEEGAGPLPSSISELVPVAGETKRIQLFKDGKPDGWLVIARESQ